MPSWDPTSVRMQHAPATRGVWYGREVEGNRYYGLETMFIARPPTDEECRRTFEHVFVTEEFTAWSWLAQNAKRWDQLTIACFPESLPMLVAFRNAAMPHADVMVRLHCEAGFLALLGDDDSVSIGVPYDLWTATRRSLIYTSPAAYQDDTP